MNLLIAIVAGAVLLSGAYFIRGVIVAYRTPATVLTFDQHAAVATALLQPDAPTLPEPMTFAEQVEMWLELHTAKES